MIGQQSTDDMDAKTLYTLSFFTNAVVLVFEITGGRLLAPYLGTSVGVWAGLIAVVLGAMALGYHIGGRLGDSNASEERIGFLLFLSGIATLSTWALRDMLPSGIGGINPTTGALLIGSVLFAPTVTLLAVISPLLAKNLLRTLETSAQTVGTLNMVGTIGAIAGAVVTGIYLIPSFGVDSIFLGIAVLLCLVSFAIRKKRVALYIAITLLLFSIAFFINTIPTRAAGWLGDVSSAYNRIIITAKDGDDPTRAVWTSPFGIQCQMYVDETGHADESRLVETYQKAHDIFIANWFPQGPTRTLFLGGCIGAFPRYLLHTFPNMLADMVEIDPAMIQVAKEYFSFDADSFPTLSLIYEDARVFVNSDHASYDLVYIDAFGSSGRVPFHLVTTEMFERLALHVSSDGLLLMNTHGTYEGLGATYPAIFIKSARASFEHVSLYQFTDEPHKSQNLIIAASHTRELPDELTDPRYPTLTLRRVDTTDQVIEFTDNYAPVEGFTRERLLLPDSNVAK